MFFSIFSLIFSLFDILFLFNVLSLQCSLTSIFNAPGHLGRMISRVMICRRTLEQQIRSKESTAFNEFEIVFDLVYKPFRWRPLDQFESSNLSLKIFEKKFENFLESQIFEQNTVT